MGHELIIGVSGGIAAFKTAALVSSLVQEGHGVTVVMTEAEAPQYAVSVFVERGGSMGNEATGGHVAAPIAAKILKYLLGK